MSLEDIAEATELQLDVVKTASYIFKRLFFNQDFIYVKFILRHLQRNNFPVDPCAYILIRLSLVLVFKM